MFLSDKAQAFLKRRADVLADPAGTTDLHEIGKARGWIECFKWLQELPGEQLKTKQRQAVPPPEETKATGATRFPSRFFKRRPFPS
jgi:hypothetical protein